MATFSGRLEAEDARELFKKGLALADQFKFNEAIEQFKGCIELLHDGSTLAREARKQIDLARQRDREFSSELRENRLSDANKRRLRELLLQANELFLKKEYGAAIERYEKIIDFLPVEANVFFSYGVACAENGDTQKARAAFVKALALDPRHKKSIFRLVQILIQEKNYQPILALVDKELALLEKDLVDQEKASVEFRGQGLYDQEALANQKITRLKEELGHLLFLRGKAFHHLARADRAVEDLKRSLRYRPDHVDTLILQGRAMDLRKMYLSSSQSFERALDLLTAEHAALIKKGNELLEQGENDSVMAIGEQTMKLKEKMGTIHFLLGRTLFRRELNSQAIPMLEKAVELNPGFVDAGFFLSQVHAREGDLEKAISIVRDILKASPAGSENARLALSNLKVLLNLSVAEAMRKKGIFLKEELDPEAPAPVPLKDYPIPGARKLEHEIIPITLRLQEAQKAHASGDLESAKGLYHRIIEHDGSNVESLKGLAKIAQLEKDLPLELKHLERALALSPNDLETRMNYAYSLLNNDQDLERALRLAAAVISEDGGGNPDSLHTYGWGLFKNGFLDEAIQVFQKVLAIDPGYAIASHNLGTAYYLNDEFDLAGDLFEKLAANPAFETRARLFLGLIALKKQDSRAALDQFTRVSEKAAKDPVMLGYVHRILGRIEEARKLGRGLDPIDLKRPSDSPKWIEVARALFDRGVYPRAIDTLQFALKKDPKNFDALKLMGKIHFARKSYSEAVPYWVLATEVLPGAYEIHVGLGKCFYKLRKLPESLEYFSRAFALEQRDPEVAYYLGLVKLEQNDLPLAEKFFRKSILLSGDFGRAHLMLGALLMKKGQYEEARNEFLRARTAPEASKNIQELARTHIRQAESLLYARKEGPFKKSYNYIDELALAQKERPEDLATLGERLAATQTARLVVVRKEPPAKKLDEQIERYKKLESFKLHLPNYKLTDKKGAVPSAPPPPRKADPADALLVRGNSEAIAGRIDLALEIYRQGLALSQGNAELYFNMGFLEVLLLKYATAFQSFQKILENPGQEGLAYNALGNLLWLSGDGARAVRAWRAASRYPLLVREPNVLLPYAGIWKKFLEANPGDPDALLNQAIVQLFEGRDREANTSLEGILKQDSYRNDIKFYAGMARVKTYLAEKDFFLLKRAMAQYNEILDLDPGFPQVKKLLFVMGDLKAQN